MLRLRPPAVKGSADAAAGRANRARGIDIDGGER